jgi:hypothetical protein
MSSEADWEEIERRIAIVTTGTRRPVAVTFLDEAPKDAKRSAGSQPSGCSFWRLA